ncbi:MAG: deoxyhypusine synthase family protein [Candidatus Thorarchaeota archaeon]|nr:deoxyhypusine synthase family protein [Candidatus Thorarchaeota archaeon]
MQRVKHIKCADSATIPELVSAMREVGVLGAGRLGRAAAIVHEMFSDPDCFTYLSLSGPMIPGGLRYIVSRLIADGFVDALVTSGANIVHDLIEAYGGGHYRVPTRKTESELREAGMGRIGDIIVKEGDFETFEKRVYAFLDGLTERQRTGLAPSEFIAALGASIEDSESVVRQAYLKNVPVFSPGLMDSMLGFHMYTYSTMKPLSLDFVKDLRILGEIITSVKKTGAIMLGGGLTKHFTMGSTILKGGLDLAVQITMDRPEAGSLSGAPLAEGVSWQKIQCEARYETVIGDATVLFPLLILGCLKTPLGPDTQKHSDDC